MLHQERITYNPKQCGGKPCIRGMRVRVKDILEMLAGGMTEAEILADFEYLESLDIRAALEYASMQADHPVLKVSQVKFLLDAHLPPVLARVMAREGYEVVHLFDLNMNAAADLDIWKYAGENDYVVISKDEDFIRWQADVRNGPRFIWVRTGNCKNKELINIIIGNLPAVIELLDSGSAMVEVLRES